MWERKDVFIGISIIVIFLIFYTLFVNCIFWFPSFFPISGDAGDWIAYNGSILGALISIGVIAFTLRQNKILHEELKAFQIGNSIYALERERLSKIESILKDEMFLLSPYRMSEIITKNGDLKDNFIGYINNYTTELLRTEEEANFYINVYNENIDLAKLQNPRAELCNLFDKTLTSLRHYYTKNSSTKQLPTFQEYFITCMDKIKKSDEYTNYRTTALDIIIDAEKRLNQKLIKPKNSYIKIMNKYKNNSPQY